MILKQIIALLDAAVRFIRRLRFSVDVFYRKGRMLLCLFLLPLLLCGCSAHAEQPVLEPVLTREQADSSLPGTEESVWAGRTDPSGPETEESVWAGRTDLSRSETEEPVWAGRTDPSGPEGEDPAASGNVTVHVCGEVRKEGVYRLPAGSRILDAVEAAGGFTDEADRSYLNLALQIEDAWQIRVPSKEETENLPGPQQEELTGTAKAVESVQNTGHRGGLESVPETGRINLNTASKEELMKIPGVGEAKAQRIVDYREKNGRFEAVEDLMKVPGIKNASFQKMKDYITV